MTTLTGNQQWQIDRARELLAQPYETDLMSLAQRTGALEWHLAEMIRLAEQLVSEAAS